MKKELPKQVLTHTAFRQDPIKALQESFLRANQKLKEHCRMDSVRTNVAVSGCTATLVLQIGRVAYLAHVGDSRAMVCTLRDGHLALKYVTEDHKPTRTDERTRIGSSNGEVRLLENETVPRLFIKGKNFPGIAVSRAFGDSVAASAGLICEPEVAILELTSEDAFIFVASDGIWEFLTEPEILMLIEDNSWENAASVLVESSWAQWLQHEDCSDDMTVLLLSLQSPSSEVTPNGEAD